MQPVKVPCYVCSGTGWVPLVLLPTWARQCPCCKGKEYITAQEWAKYKEKHHG